MALWTWTGYYLGIKAGYSWGRSSTDAFFNDNTIPGALFATASTFGSRVRCSASRPDTISDWEIGCGASRRTRN